MDTVLDYIGYALFMAAFFVGVGLNQLCVLVTGKALWELFRKSR